MNDVCLILEGTYPFLTGGVSTWVDGLMSGMPDITFSVAHLGVGAPRSGRPAYALPANCTQLAQVPLDPDRLDVSGDAADGLPGARVYHALSTGAASQVAARAATTRGRPFLLTEHGLAWKEVMVGADHLESGRALPHLSQPVRGRSGSTEVRRLWSEWLVDAAVAAYREASVITTVCQANARLQQRLGAPAARSMVVPNAVAAASTAEADMADRSPSLVGLIGRVVPIKDVVTFLRACRLVSERLPGARFAVIGPLDHDPAYADDCQELAVSLGLGGRVRFPGEADVAQWLRLLDVAVLTSVSEAQPLALLEAMAAGLPVVATAVGGCPELIGGTAAGADRQPCGLLTPTGAPRATADAIVDLLSSDVLRARLGRAGAQRARDLHCPGRLLSSYRRIYERLATAAPRSVALRPSPLPPGRTRVGP